MKTMGAYADKLKHLAEKAFNQKSPRHSLLGLRNLPIKTIIDAGANRGRFAKHMKPLFPKAHLYCFEPLPEPFKKLKKWTEKHGNEKITAFNLALGDNEGIFEMHSPVEHDSSSSFLKTTKTCESLYPFTKKQISIPVKMTTLDKWLKSLSSPLAPEILIKMDVEGYEDRVIQGGGGIFSNAKACILEVCLDRLYEDQATFKNIFLLLDDFEYRYAGNLNQSYANDGHAIYIDALFVKGRTI